MGVFKEKESVWNSDLLSNFFSFHLNMKTKKKLYI